VPDVAPQGPAADAARRRDHSARHGVWQRRSARTGAHQAGAGGPRQHRVRARARALGSPSPGGGAESYLLLDNGTAQTSGVSH
jgi:hypothetical protein